MSSQDKQYIPGGSNLPQFKDYSDIQILDQNGDNTFYFQGAEEPQILTNQQKKVQTIKSQSTQTNLVSNTKKGCTKKSQYKNKMILILKQYEDIPVIGKLIKFIEKYHKQIRFNNYNVKSVEEFIKQNQNYQKLESFTNIFMDVTHIKNNGMLYMFTSLDKINNFLQYLDSPLYKQIYKEVVNDNLMNIYTKCSNKKIPTLKDLENVITLKDYQKDLKTVLDSAEVKCISDLAGKLKDKPQQFQKQFSQSLQLKRNIQKILQFPNYSQQQIKIILALREKKNQIYEYVEQNMISGKQRVKLLEVLKSYKEQKNQSFIVQKMQIEDQIIGNQQSLQFSEIYPLKNKTISIQQYNIRYLDVEDFLIQDCKNSRSIFDIEQEQANY